MLLYNMQIILNVMLMVTNITQIFKVQGAFYEIAVLLTTPSGQPDYYEKKKIIDSGMDFDKGTMSLNKVDFHYPTKKDV